MLRSMKLYRALAGLLLVVIMGAAQLGAQAAAAEEAPPEVEGIEITRPDGRFLGLTMDGLNLRLTFYDADKKPERVDVVRGTARWKPPTGGGFERAVLNPADDGVSLRGNQVIRKPWIFTVQLALVDASGEVVETHQVELTEEALSEPKS